MTAATSRPTLEQLLTEAREAQLAARMIWARNPSAANIEAEVKATALVNELLDLLLARTAHGR